MSLKLDMEGMRKYFEGLISRARLIDGWLNRIAYPELLNTQRKRWQTEGASEGQTWQPISASYATSKSKRFADYPGAGQKLLIATGRLAYSMTLTSSLHDSKSKDGDHFKLVRQNKLEMGSFVPYAKYVNDERDITTIGHDTQQRLVRSLSDYLLRGNLGI